MATTDRKVSAGDIISATVRYTNKDDAGRSFDISANVGVSNGTVNSFDSGEVRPVRDTSLPGTEESVSAQFRSYSPESLGVDFHAAPETAQDILVAIYEFISDVRSSAETTGVEHND